MTYEIIILKEAQADFRIGFYWYQAINEELSRRFKENFKAIIKSIKENPYSFQERFNNIRMVSMSKFPFVICYTVENKAIIVKSIFHTARNPKNYPK